jgi:hypothetical protein
MKKCLPLTAPNLKWPVVVRWEKFSTLDMQFSRRLPVTGHLRLAANRYKALQDVQQ